MKNFKLMMTIIQILTILFISSCSKQAVDTTKPIIANVLFNDMPLKELNPNILIGSHINIENEDSKYLNIIKTEFNACQALWFPRWNDGWDSVGVYDFSRLNKNINFLKENGISSQVHMLVGPDIYMPDWLINGNWEDTDLDILLRDMIYSIMDANNNKDKVDIWDVINELFDDDGTYRKNMVWNKMGWEIDNSGLTGVDKINDQHPIFIRKAFTYCREKTSKKLELRDFNIENNDPKYDNDKRHKGFYQLLKHMINSNIPIDVVGIQGHLSVGNTSWRLDNNAMKETVQKFKALGLEVYITELDARIEDRTWTPDLAQKQKNDYHDYIKQAIEGGVTRINLWGIQDGLDKGWITKEHPLPWDENLEKKPAYWGLGQALKDTK